MAGADRRTRGAEGSPVASVVSLDVTHLAEGNGLSRLVDFGVATVATPGMCGSGELSGAASEHCATNRKEGDSDARLEMQSKPPQGEMASRPFSRDEKKGSPLWDGSGNDQVGSHWSACRASRFIRLGGVDCQSAKRIRCDRGAEDRDHYGHRLDKWQSVAGSDFEHVLRCQPVGKYYREQGFRDLDDYGQGRHRVQADADC